MQNDLIIFWARTWYLIGMEHYIIIMHMHVLCSVFSMGLYGNGIICMHFIFGMLCVYVSWFYDCHNIWLAIKRVRNLLYNFKQILTSGDIVRAGAEWRARYSLCQHKQSNIKSLSCTKLLIDFGLSSPLAPSPPTSASVYESRFSTIYIKNEEKKIDNKTKCTEFVSVWIHHKLLLYPKCQCIRFTYGIYSIFCIYLI